MNLSTILVWIWPLIFLGPSDFILESPSGKEFVCQKCGKIFGDRSNCRRHIRAMHTHETPEACAICGNVLKNKNSLMCHIRQYHPESKETAKLWL